MPTVIRVVSLVDLSWVAERPYYVKTFDPDLVAPDRGTSGDLDVTPELAQAKRYPDHGAAFAEWRRQSKALPLRPWDGQPNRPMTAFNVLFETVE